MKTFRTSLSVLMLCVTILRLTSLSLAQDVEPVEALNLAGQPVVLEFSTGAAGPPTVEPLTDGRMTFRIQVAGEIRGAFEGSLSALVSEVTAMPSPPLHPVTVMFTIETEDGSLEGFYAGSLYLAEGSDQAAIHAYGQILSVSGAYADLYLADVFVMSAVQFVDGRSVGESGTMTITVPDTLMYADPNGMFTVNYPAALTTVRPDLAREFGLPFPSVAFANSDETLDLSTAAQLVPEGGWGIAAMFIPETFFTAMEMPEDAPLIDRATVFFPQEDNAEGLVVAAINEITLANGAPAIQAEGAGETEDTYVVFMQMGDGLYVMVSMISAPGGRTAEMVDGLMTVVNSIEFTGTVDAVMPGMNGN